MKKRSISITQQGEYMTETITRGSFIESLTTRIDGEPIKVGDMLMVSFGYDTGRTNAIKARVIKCDEMNF